MLQKRYFFVVVVILLSLLVVATGMAAPQSDAAQTTDTKQIAAPPADVLDGSLNLPDPAQVGVRSRSAMIPVSLTPAADGQLSWSGEFALDGDNISLALFAPDAQNWHLAVQAPGSELVALDQAASESVSLGIEDASYPGELYSFAGYEAGSWTIEITAGAQVAAETAVDGYLVLSSDSPYQLYTHLSTHALLAGNEVGLVTYAYDADSSPENGAPAPLAGTIEAATLVLQTPAGEMELAMADDGLHADGEAGDGVFGATFVAQTVGNYTAQVYVTGKSAAGEAFTRTSQHAFPIIAPALQLTDRAVSAAALDDTRMQLKLRGTAVAGALPNVTAFAEVWGTDAKGEMAPVAWIGGIAAPSLQGSSVTLPLTLDARWIALAGVSAPFELRNIRVQDLDTSIPLAQLDRLDMYVRQMPEAAYSTVTEVTDDMLMGAHPTVQPAAPTAGVVMLIHGYCSGANTWPTSHFSSYAVFSDLNQNRSHDQFAQLIDSYGDNFSSFGAIAHSQGGAASLHLYTYYWSGLDNSSGSRLIQTVGTPYQGTALAGNLALIGDIFGVGCGTNWDLTYDGASLWLSNIPSWARSRVYYHTTSFTDKWWRYDYCNIASDLFLSDPDDGVIEKWAGQLSGANNLGHKTGWCHTTDMRDPGQTQDSSRNSNMNTYANR
ncbi:MAG: choice-of-anchor X domain-containing protein [Chloroflexota bacterium]